MVTLPIYLDYQATTPLDPRVLEAMMPYLTNHFGNPHSLEHSFGWRAAAAVDIARKDVADLIGAFQDDIIFTSGATESNNLAIKGIAYGAYPKKDHIITVSTEHECVLGCVHALEKSGFKVTYLAVDNKGFINIDELANAITDKTSLISVMAINNEIGVIQNLKKIGEIARKNNIIFHTDAAQAIGKIPIDVNEMNIDVMSISGHKIYGPKAIGALYLRKNTTIIPIFDGGGQENGLRSGTLSPALCMGFGKACAIAGEQMDDDAFHIEKLSKYMKDEILSKLQCANLNGSVDQRFFGNLNFTFKGIKSDLLVADLKDVAISTGSACSSASAKTSYVLKELGLDDKDIRSSVRIGIGRMTTFDEVEYAAAHIIKSVKNLS